MDFSEASHSHRLQFFNNHSSVGPFCVYSPLGLYCSTVCTPWATAPGRNLLWLGSPQAAALSQHVHLIQPGWTASTAGWRSASLCCSMGFSGTGHSALMPEAPPLPPSSLSLVTTGLFLTFSHSCVTAAMLLTEATPADALPQKNFHINAIPHKKTH